VAFAGSKPQQSQSHSPASRIGGFYFFELDRICKACGRGTEEVSSNPRAVHLEGDKASTVPEKKRRDPRHAGPYRESRRKKGNRLFLFGSKSGNMFIPKQSSSTISASSSSEQPNVQTEKQQ
jgi:hypothetical protein